MIGRFVAALLISALGAFGQLRFEGRVPAEINPLFMASEYTRIYRKVAPMQRPDRSPLRIIYYSKNDTSAKGIILPEWGGGGTIGGNLIVIPVDFKPFLQQNFTQITVHELVHAVLYRAYPGVNVPRWFHEGLAMMLSGELSFEENTVVSKAVLFNRLMPLASIDSVNDFSRGRADLAYSESHIALLFLVDQYGMDIVPDFLIAARKRHDFWLGVYDVVGLSPREFEELTRQYIASKYKLLFVFTDTYAWWVGIVLLFIVGVIVTLRRNRRRMAILEAREQREAAAAAGEQSRSGLDLPAEADKSPTNEP